MLLLVELISKKESLYTDTFDRKDLALDRKDPTDIDKAAEMSGGSENTKMPNIRHIFPKSKHTNSNRSRSECQSI